jgi:hypothetical protein
MALIPAAPGPVKKKKSPPTATLENKDEWTGVWMIRADLMGWRSFFAKDLTLLIRYKLSGDKTKVVKVDMQFSEEGYGATSAKFIVDPILHHVGLYVAFEVYFSLSSGFGKAEAKGVELPLGGRSQTCHCWGGINCGDGTGVAFGEVLE